MEVDTEEAALQLLFEAEANRAVAQHQLNNCSSRSHVLYMLQVTMPVAHCGHMLRHIHACAACVGLRKGRVTGSSNCGPGEGRVGARAQCHRSRWPTRTSGRN